LKHIRAAYGWMIIMAFRLTSSTWLGQSKPEAIPGKSSPSSSLLALAVRGNAASRWSVARSPLLRGFFDLRPISSFDFYGIAHRFITGAILGESPRCGRGEMEISPWPFFGVCARHGYR